MDLPVTSASCLAEPKYRVVRFYYPHFSDFWFRVERRERRRPWWAPWRTVDVWVQVSGNEPRQDWAEAAMDRLIARDRANATEPEVVATR
jgi:hypothetical protein